MVVACACVWDLSIKAKIAWSERGDASIY
jgi:hypothetical protein